MLFAANRSPRPFSPDQVALLGSLAALAAVSIVQTRSAEEVRRHTAGVERAAAAHDRFAELVLAGGGVDDITKAARRPARRLGGAARLRGRGA